MSVAVQNVLCRNDGDILATNAELKMKIYTFEPNKYLAYKSLPAPPPEGPFSSFRLLVAFSTLRINSGLYACALNM